MNVDTRHPFDVVSFALGVLVAAVGLALLLGGSLPDVDAGLVLPIAAVVVGLALLVTTLRGTAEPDDPARDP